MSPAPKQEIDLSTALPTNDDFRTSLLMSGLSARFSMLREQDDPNSMLGKASDDSVLSPRRASRLQIDFRTRGDLSDIEEVASIHGSIRPPFTPSTSEFNRHDGYDTDDDIGYHQKQSMLDRPRQAEGNMLFGGRQKIYKIAPGNSTGRQLYDHDVSQTTFQKHRRAERQQKEALQALDAKGSSQFTFDAFSSSRPSEESSSADAQRQSHDTSSSTHSHPSNMTRTSTAATSITSGTPVPTSNPLPPHNGSFMRPNSPTFVNQKGQRTRRYEQNLDQQLLEKQASKPNIFEILPKSRPSQTPHKPPTNPPEATLQPPPPSFGSKAGRSFKPLAISTANQKDIEAPLLTPASVNSQSETDGERLLGTVSQSPRHTAIKISDSTTPKLVDTLGPPPGIPGSRKSSLGLPSFIDTDPNPGPRHSSGAGLRSLVAQHMRQDSGASSVYTQATGPARSPRFGPPAGMEFLSPGSRNTFASNTSGGTRRFDFDEWDAGYLGGRESVSSASHGHQPSVSRQMDNSRLIPGPLDVSMIGLANGDTPQPTPTTHVRETSSVSTSTQKEQDEFIGELRNARQRVQLKMKSYHEAGSPQLSGEPSPTLPNSQFTNQPRLPKQASKGSLRNGGSKAMKMWGMDSSRSSVEQSSRPPTADVHFQDRDRSTSDASRHHAESPRSPLEALKQSFSRAQENLSANPGGRAERPHLMVASQRSGVSNPSSSVSANTDSSTFSRYRANSRNPSPGSMTQPSTDGSSSSQSGRLKLDTGLPGDNTMGSISIQRPGHAQTYSPLSPFSSNSHPEKSGTAKSGSTSRSFSPQGETGRFANFIRRDRKRSINKSSISDPVLLSRTTERLQTIDLRGAIENASATVSDEVMMKNLIPIEQASGGRASPAPFQSRPSAEVIARASGLASPAMGAIQGRMPPAAAPVDPRRQRPHPSTTMGSYPNDRRRLNPPSTSSISTTASRSYGRPSSSRDGAPENMEAMTVAATPQPRRTHTDPIAGTPYSQHAASKPPAIVNSIKPPSMEKYKYVNTGGLRMPTGHPYSSASMYVNGTPPSDLSPPQGDRYAPAAADSRTSSPRNLSRQGTRAPSAKDWDAQHPPARPGPSQFSSFSSGSNPSSPQSPGAGSKRQGAFRMRGAESRERDRNDVNKRSENLWGRLKKSTSDGGGLSSRASREKRDRQRRMLRGDSNDE